MTIAVDLGRKATIQTNKQTHNNLSCNIGFPTMLYVRPTKPQISLCICTVWSEPLLVAGIFYDPCATDRTAFGVSKLNRRLHRLVWVDLYQNATLLEISCCGSFVKRGSVHEIVALIAYVSSDSSKAPAHISSITTVNAAHTRKKGMQMMLRLWFTSLVPLDSLATLVKVYIDLVVFMRIAGTS